MKTRRPLDGQRVSRLPRTGELVGARYLLLGELGQGAMGVVFRARDLESGAFVALKLLKPEAMLIPGVRERFDREVRLSLSFAHPNAVATHAFGFHAEGASAANGDQGLPFLVMELLEGEPLSQRLHTRRLRFQEATQLLTQVLSCLARAHRKGLVHRDLKPDNVFICATQPATVKVLDFGLAKALHADAGQATQALLTLPGMSGGTPAYMPPEQAVSLGEASPSADIYALGCMGYHMFAGRMPFTGSLSQVLQAHAVQPPPSLPGALAEHPVQAVLHQAMAKHPALRYPDAEAMLEAFQRAASRRPSLGRARRSAAPPSSDSDLLATRVERRDVSTRATVGMRRDAVPEGRRALAGGAAGATTKEGAGAGERSQGRLEAPGRSRVRSAAMMFDRRELAAVLKRRGGSREELQGGATLAMERRHQDEEPQGE